MIRVASFNMENLFTRPVAMNQDNELEARQAIDDYAIANNIVAKEVYEQATRPRFSNSPTHTNGIIWTLPRTRSCNCKRFADSSFAILKTAR